MDCSLSPIQQHLNKLRGPIVVLGASGFVGANLFHTITAQRNDVFAVINQNKGWRLASSPNEKVFAVNLNDANTTQTFFDTVRPMTIFDCVAYGAYSFQEDVSKIYQTNFQSLVTSVELLKMSNISSYIHAGSSSEYGFNSDGPSEDTPSNSNSHYSVAKSAASQYLRYVGKQHGFPCLNLRLYSIYGQLEDTSRLIPQLLKKGLEKDFPLLVDLNTSRDFVYINDACSAFIMAAAQIHPSLYGEAYNIGSGEKTTIQELVEWSRDEFKIRKKPKYDTMSNRLWDTKDWFSNPQKAFNDFGWKATTPLGEGLRKTTSWLGALSNQSFEAGSKLHENKNSKRSVSAIVACYKDEDAITHMYSRLTTVFQELGVKYEIIFVNDCSPDKSAKIIEELSAQDINVLGVSHSRNFGSQMAFRSGMELSSMDGVVLLDGDLQDPPELIKEFYGKWDDGYQVVYGRRIKREMPFYMEFFYRSFYRIFAAFSYINIPRDAGDFSLMDRRVVTWLLRCPEGDLFLRGLRAYVGFKQIGVDYVRPERMFGKSTNNFFKNLDWAKRGIFSFSNVPLAILTTLGLLLLVLSIFLTVVAVFIRLSAPELVPRGLTTLLITSLLIGSLNLFAIGLVGEYIAKIMTEVKRRPKLIRSALIRNGKTTELAE